MKPNKTYKRAVAVAMLVYYFGVRTAGVWSPDGLLRHGKPRAANTK